MFGSISEIKHISPEYAHKSDIDSFYKTVHFYVIRNFKWGSIWHNGGSFLILY